jgi:hypothetical protein
MDLPSFLRNGPSATYSNKERSKSIDDLKNMTLDRRNSFSPLKSASSDPDWRPCESSHNPSLPMVGLASIGVTKKKRSNSVKVRRSPGSSSNIRQEVLMLQGNDSLCRKFDKGTQQQRQPIRDLIIFPEETTHLQPKSRSSTIVVSPEISNVKFHRSSRQKARSSSPSKVERRRNLSTQKLHANELNFEHYSASHVKKSLSPGRRLQRSENSSSRNRRKSEELNSDDSIDDDPRSFQPKNIIQSRRKSKSFIHQSRSLSPCIGEGSSRRHVFSGKQGKHDIDNFVGNTRRDAKNTRSASMDRINYVTNLSPSSNEMSQKFKVTVSSSDELSLDALVQSKLNDIPALDFSRSRTVHMRAISEEKGKIGHKHRSLSPCIRQGHSVETFQWQHEMSRSLTKKDSERLHSSLRFPEKYRLNDDVNFTSSSPNFRDYEMKLPSDDDSGCELPLSRYLKMVNESEHSTSQGGSLNSDELARLLQDSSDLDTFVGEDGRTGDHHNVVESRNVRLKEMAQNPQGGNLNLIELLEFFKEDNLRDMPHHRITILSESPQDEEGNTNDYGGSILTLEEMADILNHVSSRHWSNKDIRWDVIADMARGIGGDRDVVPHPLRPMEYVGGDYNDEDDDSDVSSISWEE